MPKENKDKGLRLVVGIILLLIGISGFGMASFMGPMMGWHMGYYGGFNILRYIVSIGVTALGTYLIYDGLKD